MPQPLRFSEDVLRLNPDLARVGKSAHVKPAKSKAESDGFDSDLERDFFSELRARGLVPMLHPFTLHLPGSVDYTPDFMIQDPLLTVYEVKGDNVKNTRDSWTRFRVSAGLFRCWIWVWVTKTKEGRWVEKVYRP